MNGEDTDQRFLTDPAHVATGSAITTCKSTQKYCYELRLDRREDSTTYKKNNKIGRFLKKIFQENVHFNEHYEHKLGLKFV